MLSMWESVKAIGDFSKQWSEWKAFEAQTMSKTRVF